MGQFVKQCPFCGSKSEKNIHTEYRDAGGDHLDDYWIGYVECEECGAQGARHCETASSDEQARIYAMSAWNDRFHEKSSRAKSNSYNVVSDIAIPEHLRGWAEDGFAYGFAIAYSDEYRSDSYTNDFLRAWERYAKNRPAKS